MVFKMSFTLLVATGTTPFFARIVDLTLSVDLRTVNPDVADR